MNDEEIGQFAMGMGRMAEVFQYAISDALVSEYFKALKVYPLRQVMWAIQECITDCLFFPKPREIRDAMFSEKHEGEAEHTRKPLALPEHHDPEAYEAFKKAWREMLSKLANQKAMPTYHVENGEKVPYKDIQAQERWLMTEKHWRARWDLARLSPDMRFFFDQIPEHYRIQFAKEDADNETRR